MARTVVVCNFEQDTGATLNEVMDYIDSYRKNHPGRDVFFDGDRFAVCYIKK